MANEPRLLKFPAPATPTPPATDLLFLEVVRGQTAFPYRPVEHDRFSIGSGRECDLRLPDDFPEKHCELHWTGEQISVVAIAEEPPLLVNGETCLKRTLQTSDQISIAEIELTFWQIDAEQAAQLLADSASELESSAALRAETVSTENVSENPNTEPSADNEDSHHIQNDECEVPAGLEPIPLDILEDQAVITGHSTDFPSTETAHVDEGRSIEELIDAIESEERMVDEFEEKRQRGAAALLHEVYQRAADNEGPTTTDDVENVDKQTPPVAAVQTSLAGAAETSDQTVTETNADADQLLEDIRLTVSELTTFSSMLDQRAEDLAAREAAQIEAAQLLLEAQRELAAHIDRLHEQLVVPDRTETIRKLYRAA